MLSIPPPQVHLVGNQQAPPPHPPTRKHILLLKKKYFTNKRILYECKYLEDCLYNCLDTSGLKKYHNFLILLSKIAEIHALNKLKLYKKAPISAQLLSAVKSKEPLLTDSQCNGLDYVDINYFIGPKFQRKRCRHNGI